MKTRLIQFLRKAQRHHCRLNRSREENITEETCSIQYYNIHCRLSNEHLWNVINISTCKVIYTLLESHA